jgi:beta-lactam-binding protein with PASTA domain
MKSLAKSVGDRYPSAAAMKADIDRYLAGQPVQAPAVAAVPASHLPPDTSSEMTRVEEVDEEPERKKRGPLILLLLLLAALIVAALVFGPQLFKSAPEQQSVPTITGLTRDQAERTIRDSGLEVGEVSTAASKEVAQGRVISQSPEAGDAVDPSSEVDFVVSTGKPEVPLPDVVGQNKDDAADQLRSLGLRVVLTERDADEPKDQVVEMQPPGDTQVSDGSKVTLFWSDGPEEVPSVIGKTEAEATDLIEEAGFKVSRVTDSTTEAKKGNVLQQSPSAGQTLDKGSTVTIVVSTYEPPPTTPPASPSASPSVPTP